MIPGEVIPADGPDIYQNFVIPVDLPEDKLVAAVDFRPGAASVVHHSLLYLDNSGAARKLDANTSEPGYSTFGDPGFMPSGSIGGWSPGKAPGAYMYGAVYDVHPYLLLNFNGTFNDVSTLAHEWGHAVHTMLSTANNPYETSSYATFTAEIASTTNEVLLQEHMLAQDVSDDERLFYLGTALEAVRGTFFRQVMFAEFELRIHELVEAGEALSGQRMTRLYEELVRRYHGSDDGVLAYDPAYAIEWAFIPHFYRNFYVFQYATSIAGGTLFAERFLGGDARARDDYLAVLSAGGSRYAYELLQEYGIDLATDAPYDALIARMDRVMDEIERVLDRR